MSVDLVIQHIRRNCRIILSFVACLVVEYFFALSHNSTSNTKKKVFEHKTHFFTFSKTFV